MISAIMPARASLPVHRHTVKLYAVVCRGCRVAFYVKSECCWPLASYCDKCISIENPHFDHWFGR